MKNKKLVDFIPFFVMTGLTAISLCIYLIPMHGQEPLKIFSLFVTLIASLIIPVINLIFKIRIPFIFNCLFALFCYVSISLGSVLRLYDYIPYYDKFLHTVFGFIGAFGIFTLLIYGKGKELKPWCFYIVIMLSVIGIAGFWEIIEFICDIVAGSNMQRWLPDMAEFGDLTVSEFFKNYNPMVDTIWDMIVAVFGVVLFYVFMLIDKLCGYKVAKNIYKQVTENIGYKNVENKTKEVINENEEDINVSEKNNEQKNVKSKNKKNKTVE